MTFLNAKLLNIFYYLGLWKKIDTRPNALKVVIRVKERPFRLGLQSGLYAASREDYDGALSFSCHRPLSVRITA